MKLFGTMEIVNSTLHIGQVSTKDLAKEYGTPLYVIDEQGLIDNINIFKNSFKSERFNTNIIYASKALMNMYIADLISDLGLHMDVVSGGELFTAIESGLDPKTLYFHGNNKLPQEIQLAVESKIGMIVVDNLHEAQLISKIAKDTDYQVPVLLRINPGIEAETHKYIQTTTQDSQFGMNTNDPATLDTIQYMVESDQLDFRGLHCHIGSQVFDEKFFYEEAQLVLEYGRLVQDTLDIVIDEFNLGGGFGVYYTEEDDPFEIETFLKEYIHTIETYLEEYDLSPSTISIEPGRSLVNNYGSTLYTVGQIKPMPEGIRPFVFIDGGMTDNPRPSLYEAKYRAYIADKMDHTPNTDYRIAGKCCESGDILIDSILLPEVNAGDILVVPSTGAYNYSMSSNYNRNLRPAMVTVKDSESKVIVKRETYADLLRNDIRRQ